MVYEVRCTRCGNVEKYKSQSESINKGCGGCTGTINHKYIRIVLCSKCYSPEVLNEELGMQLPKRLKDKYDAKAKPQADSVESVS
jgi:predicted  nucleic acid-binding Zn-ribbon protein